MIVFPEPIVLGIIHGCPLGAAFSRFVDSIEVGRFEHGLACQRMYAAIRSCVSLMLVVVATDVYPSPTL
jgi:hypothetical protein